ncbi:MAG: hypothetical protein J7M14_05410, partial [Planctomycetes bacterium]|nr:hypothetical protein [Planctomycetota bacterium]
SYTLVSYSPYEAQRIVFECTRGRLEYYHRKDTGWLREGKRLPGIEKTASTSLKLFITDEGIEEIPLTAAKGGHGGSDPSLLDDFFGRDWAEKPNEQMASVEEAVQAILVGHAANVSIATGRPVDVQKLLVEG